MKYKSQWVSPSRKARAEAGGGVELAYSLPDTRDNSLGTREGQHRRRTMTQAPAREKPEEQL